MNFQPLFSSKKEDFETPMNLFRELDHKYHFNVDLAATKENTKCSVFYDDSLNKSWDNIRGFCNPPYGKNISKWFEKAFNAKNSLIVMLVPVRTDTKYFHKYILGKAEIVFIKGRLEFEINGLPCGNKAPFPSMLVIYNTLG